MKKTAALILFMLLILSSAADAEPLSGPVIPEWIELSVEDTVLTARLPIDETGTYSWRFIISNESILQLITCETIGDEEGETGDSLWVGSFMSAFQQSGHVFVQLSPSDSESAPVNAHMLHLYVREDHSIAIISIEENSWYWLDEDQCVLNISLPANPSTGFSWTYSLSGEDVLRLESAEYIPDPVPEGVVGSGGQWTARFAAAAPGYADLSLLYARPWEDKPADELTLHLFLNESGLIQPFVPQPEDEAPVGLYKSDDGSTLAIYRRADGTFSVEISIYRLTAQDDGLGEYKSDALTFTATDASGSPMRWEITRAGEGLKATVIDSSWDLLEEGSEFIFFPAA